MTESLVTERPLKSENGSCSVVSDSLRCNGLYSPCRSPGQNTGVGSLSLLQGIFPGQVLNPGLLHCRWILYQLSHQGNPRILEWVAYTVSRGFSQPRNWTRVSCLESYQRNPRETFGIIKLTLSKFKEKKIGTNDWVPLWGKCYNLLRNEWEGFRRWNVSRRKIKVKCLCYPPHPPPPSDAPPGTQYAIHGCECRGRLVEDALWGPGMALTQLPLLWTRGNPLASHPLTKEDSLEDSVFSTLFITWKVLATCIPGALDMWPVQLMN